MKEAIIFHACTPPRCLSYDTKNGSSALPDVFLDTLRLKVGSFSGLGHCHPIAIFLILLFQTSLLDWKCWKNKVKIGVGPYTGPC
jgi:hypothetical protein